MANSPKKVIVRTFAGTTHAGYLPLSGFVVSDQNSLSVPLFGLDGRVEPIPLGLIRFIAFVRDFNLSDATDPERLSRRVFLARPRSEGLWVRLTLTGGDLLEGLAPLDLALVDGLIEDHGLFLIPPDIRSNTQRLFVPRSAFTDFQILATITAPSKSRIATAETPTDQNSLFPESPAT
jgi:hypothetical protein